MNNMGKLQYLYYFLYALSFIIGITVGVVVSVSSITKKVMSKVSDQTDEIYEKIDDEKKEQIAKIITETAWYYDKLQEIRSKNSRLIFRKKKVASLEESYDLKYLVVEIAKVFYPDSQEPLLELSINEAFEVIKKITGRIDEIFIATKLSFFRYLKLSSIYIALGFFNKINSIKNHKLMQLLLRIINFSVLVTNIVNPFSLFRVQTKRKVNNSFTSFLIAKICDIIGKEVALVYCKNLVTKTEDKELIELVKIVD
jgi:hypothetical protein